MLRDGRFVCNCCQKPVGPNGFQRKSKHRVLHFCSLECNAKLLRGNVLDQKQAVFLQHAEDQLAESKWPEKEKERRRKLRDIARSAAIEATK